MTRIVLLAFALVAAFLAIAPQSILAAPLKITGAVKVTNTGSAKTDFEIVVSSTDTNISCSANGLRLNGGSNVATTPTGNNSKSVTLSWTLAIANGDTVAASFVCTQENANYFTVDAYFTPKANGTNAPTVGWRVTGSGAVYLANDRSTAVDFSDLRYQAPYSITVDSMLDLVSGPSTGTLAKVSSGTVPAGSTSSPGLLLVDPDPRLNGGDFLTSRMDAHFDDSGYSTLTAVVVMGHEHPGTSVGGVAEAPDSAQPLPASAQSSGSSMPVEPLLAGIGLIAAAVVGSGLYLKRRRSS